VDTSTPGNGTINNWTWDFGDSTPENTSQNATHLFAGPGKYMVTLTVEDTNGCTDNVTKEVTVWVNPEANFTADPVCNGTPMSFVDTSTPGNGTINNWTWDFGDGSPLNYSQHPGHTYAAADIYEVILTVLDDNGCTDTETKNVTVWAEPEVVVNDTGFCAGGSSVLCANVTNGTSPFEYTWRNVTTGAIVAGPVSTPDRYHCIPVTEGGDYNVTVVDDNGCEGTDSAAVNVSESPKVTVNDTAFCADAADMLCANVTGAQPPFNYTWRNVTTGTIVAGPVSTPDRYHCIPVTEGGDYNVTVTDTYGCEGNDSATVTVYELPTVVVDDTAFCNGASDVLCANVTGGTGPYNFVWLKDASEIANVTGQPDWHCITVTEADMYTVIVTDTHDCEGNDSATVTVYDLPTVTVDNASFCEGASVNLCANVTSGTGPFDYVWRNVTTGSVVGSVTNRTEDWHCITVTDPGTYNVTVTDENGCEGNDSATVTETEPPTVTVDDVGFCDGGSDVLIASVSGGAGGNSYLWNTGNTTPQITVTEAGEYNVTVTDSLGCEGFDNATVTVYPAPAPHISVYDEMCNLTVEFEGSASGGATPYIFEWDFDDDGFFDDATGANQIRTYPDYGLYPVALRVTDNNSCTGNTSLSVRLTCERPNMTIRVYGEDDIGPKCPYVHYRDPFDPTIIEKDSLTFNPAIILWDAAESSMSADSTNIHEKKFLRLWYEPNHWYSSDYYYPTIEVETTYMLIDRQDWLPTHGSASTTFFKFPIVEIPRQIGLGGFENEEGDPNRDNVVTLALVEGDTDMYDGSTNYTKTTNGTIRIEKTYTLQKGETVQFLDHKLQYEYLVSRDNQQYAKVTVWYAGNVEDDTQRRVVLGEFDVGTGEGPHEITWFKRHNERYNESDHPSTTWYARFNDYFASDESASITVGKELRVCDTFYVNGVRYDVMAIEVIDTTGDSKADEFKYITIKTPLPKGTGSVPDDGIVSSQWIEEIDYDENIPLNPPFNMDHMMVDDVNVVLWEPTANEEEWPIGDEDGILGEAFFPWAERYLTMQTDEILKEEWCYEPKPVGKNWMEYFGVQPIDMDNDGIWIAYDVNERILEVPALEFVYLEETYEPRFTTDLYEILEEVVESPASETWTSFDIYTRPNLYTAFELPPLPDVQTPYWNKTGDYLLTSSFLAPNSINRSDINRTPPGIPRLAFAYDVEYEQDVLGEALMGGALDIYVNEYADQATVRIYGEDDKGPAEEYLDDGRYIYEDYQAPFDPGVLQKDSITFNPAIVQWDGVMYPMSADSVDIDVKKYLRMWYEPDHEYTKPQYKHPTIEVETTYMLIDKQDKLPANGSANNTWFVFPIAEDVNTSQPGLELFENPNSDPARENVVTLSYVDGGTASGYTTEGTIRIQKDYLLAPGDKVQFLDHNLEFVNVTEHNGSYYATVLVDYAGNPMPDTGATVVLGKFDGVYKDPHQMTWFKRHTEVYETSTHPHTTWFAYLSDFDPDYAMAEIVVGKELTAGDVFYVDGVRYDVPAVMVVANDTEVLNKFKYITLRTPMPKAPTKKLVDDDGLITSQVIWTLPPETLIPLNPPFNMDHQIVDDIGYYLESDVADRIIEDYYGPLEVFYIAETIEPRYSTNLLEILNETFYPNDAPDEDWIKYDVITRPDQYTEFVLPPDTLHQGEQYRNDYLITTSFIAPNSEGTGHDIDDAVLDLPRAAFYFDAIDDTGIYINKPLGAPPIVFNEAPMVDFTVTPGSPVEALVTVSVCTDGTTDDQFDDLPPRALAMEIDWGDGTVERADMPNATAPVCFEHRYLEQTTYTIAVTATDRYGLKDTKTDDMAVSNNGAILVFGPGWNAFSTPVVNTSDVDALFSDFDWYYALYTWDETAQDWRNVLSTETLDPKRGYFVHGPSSGTATLELTGTQAVYNDGWMQIGWNLVGVGFTPNELISGKWAYWYDPIPRSYVATHDMEPGKGYFIKRTL
jgi:PKD repeat protein